MIESCILSRSPEYFISETQKNDQHFRIGSLFSSSCGFLEESYIPTHKTAVICNHWADSLQRVFHFHKSASLFWFYLRCWVFFVCLFVLSGAGCNNTGTFSYHDISLKAAALIVGEAISCFWLEQRWSTDNYWNWTCSLFGWVGQSHTHCEQCMGVQLFCKECCVSVSRCWAKCL